MTDEQNKILALTEQLERKQDEIDRLRDRPSPLRLFVQRAEVYPFPNQPWWERLIDRYRGFVPQSGVQIIKHSGLFDADWYLAQDPELQKDRLARTNPAKHYYKVGARKGLNPGPNFDTQFYLANNTDVRSAGVNPLVHYVRFGQDEGRACVR
ncbi:hypothetical protein [Marinimicrobium locisalis]|uniref:hypothetical protein n=1 Tax=Marinimicrobium locisalis TaxID=546022 RepID=UPI003221631D